MRRRMQGFIRQGTQNEANNNYKVDQSYGMEADSNQQCTSKDQIMTDRDAGRANSYAKDQSGLPINRQDAEISKELLKEVIEQYQQQLLQRQQSQQQSQQQPQQQLQQQYQQQQAQGKEQQISGQKNESEQNKLQSLIAKLLLGKNNDEVSPATYGQETNNPILAANDNSLQQYSQQANQQQGQEIIQPMTGKIAAQVLSEAQYELANELEVSLNKLRAVIDESKQIAQKISKVLEENGGGSGSNQSDN